MATKNPDRDWLYALMALRSGLIGPDVLAEALDDREDRGAEALGPALRDRGGLSPEDAALLDGLVTQQLGRHGDDPARSLADLDPAGSVRRMLSLIARTRSTDRDPNGDGGSSADTAKAADGGKGRAVGRDGSSGPRFRIVRPHARGGLGEVFLAIDDELNRVVALKRLQGRHADDPRSQLRFLVEGEITGGLEHPGIVPVYGLGLDDRDGRPYYAMRLIRGESLDAAIRRFHEADRDHGGDPAGRSLELRQLLGRFVDVCDAMAYAHSRGVLHRDLKPSNIMLGRYGETLIVDWGLAKASGRGDESDTSDGATAAAGGAEAETEGPLRPRSGSEPVETAAGAVCGTPAYMSPEQAAGDVRRIGPASDVYSLGATLYCLLTGRPPFGPSTGDLLAKVVLGEFLPPRALRPDVPAALEAICLMAMARDPATRYPTPRELAQDVERWLADEPVSALREPWAERARRWTRRHRGTVTAAAAALIVALIALGGILALESQSNRRLRLANERETHARERAQARFRLARDAVAGYYRGVSEDVLLRRGEFGDLRRSLLNSAMEFYRQLAATIEADPDPEPDARLDLARADLALARITREIGSSGNALTSARQARDLLARLAAERPDDRSLRREQADILMFLHYLHKDTGQPDSALAALGAAIAIRRELARAPDASPIDRRGLAATLGNLGNLLDDLGREDEAMRAYEECRKLFQAMADEQPENDRHASDLARVLSNVGGVLVKTGRLDEAMRAAEESHAVRQRLARAHPDNEEFRGDLAGSHMYLGRLLGRVGRLDEAIEAQRQAAEINRALVAARPNSTKLRRHLANNYNDIGFYEAEAHREDEALRAFRRAREIQEALVAANPDNLEYPNDLATSLVNIGEMEAATGHPERTLPLYEESLKLRSRLADANPADPHARSKLAWTYQMIGMHHAEAGRPGPAIEPMARALEIRQALADAHPDLAELRADLAESLRSVGVVDVELGRADDGLSRLARARELQEALCDSAPQNARFHRDLARTWLEIGRAHRRDGRPSEALKSQEEARARLLDRVRDHPEDVENRNMLGQSWAETGSALAALGRPVEAVAAYRKAVTHFRAASESAPRVVRFRSDLDEALVAIQDLDFPVDPFR